MTLRSLGAACALVAGLAMSPAAAQEDGVRRFQKDQALDYLRARGRALQPISFDLPTQQLQESLFERAGGKLLRAPTQEQLSEQLIVNTYRMLLLGGNGCCPCSAAASCSDALFCNGAEICASGNCAAGSTACVDGNPCTIDTCTETTDTCSFPPVPPPAAVSQLNVNRSAPLSTVATLAWSPVGGASAYNIYRGASANLGGLACFQGGVAGTSQNDDGAVPGPAFYFLVSSLACGESVLGTGNPDPRPPAPGCP